MAYIAVNLVLFALRALAGLRGRRYLYWPVLIALFLFSAFRFEVGCDWTGYLNQFHIAEYIGEDDLFALREGLWWRAILLVRAFELPYPWLNVVSSLAFFAGVHALARRQPDPLSFLVLLFPILIINMPMSGIRQGAAIGLTGFAFAAFMDQKLVRYVAFVGLATLVHSSAAIFLLLAPSVNGAFSWRRIAVSALLAVPGAYLLLSSDGAEMAISRYVQTGLDAQGALFRLLLLATSGAFFLLVLRTNWQVLFPRDYKLAIVGALGMSLVICVWPVSSVIGDRLGYYFVILQAMIFARIPFLRLGQRHRLFTFAPYAVLFLVFVVWVALSGLFEQCYLPYQNWIVGFPDSRIGILYGP